MPHFPKRINRAVRLLPRQVAAGLGRSIRRIVLLAAHPGMQAGTLDALVNEDDLLVLLDGGDSLALLEGRSNPVLFCATADEAERLPASLLARAASDGNGLLVLGGAADASAWPAWRAQPGGRHAAWADYPRRRGEFSTPSRAFMAFRLFEAWRAASAATRTACPCLLLGADPGRQAAFAGTDPGYERAQWQAAGAVLLRLPVTLDPAPAVQPEPVAVRPVKAQLHTSTVDGSRWRFSALPAAAEHEAHLAHFIDSIVSSHVDALAGTWQLRFQMVLLPAGEPVRAFVVLPDGAGVPQALAAAPLSRPSPRVAAQFPQQAGADRARFAFELSLDAVAAAPALTLFAAHGEQLLPVARIERANED